MNQESRSDIPEEFRKLDELERKASPGKWEYQHFQSGTRCVAITGRRGLYENRSQKCECCPATALHWVGAPHDEQEIANLSFTAEAKAQGRPLLTQLSEAREEIERLREAALWGLDSTVAWLNDFEAYKKLGKRPSSTLVKMYEQRRTKILEALKNNKEII